MTLMNSQNIISAPLQSIIRFFLLLTGLAFFSAVCLHIIILLLMFPWSPSQLITADELEPCELIVFLGGAHFERIDYAFFLAERGYSKRLYTPHLGNSKTREHINEKIKNLSLPVHFYSEESADSTYEEALYTMRYLKKYNLKSILLVTSPYHSLRASWIFRKVMPKIKIVSAPCCLKSSSLKHKLESYHANEKRKLLLYYLLYAWRSYSID